MKRFLGWLLLLVPVLGLIWIVTGMLRHGVGRNTAEGHTSELNADAGLGSKPTSLRGVYGIAQGSVSEPVLRVDEVKEGYQFSERVEDEWGVDPQAPHTATEDEVKQALGLTSVTGFPVYGLVTDRMMLLKVPAGWTSPAGATQTGFTTKTGFLVVNGRKLVEAKKLELGGR